MKSPKITVLDSWPQPSSVSEAVLFATETQLFLRYLTSNDGIAIIIFPLVKTFQFGAPNDEALGGHSLAKYGLEFYSVHLIKNSPWIEELEQRNSVHPYHDQKRYMEDIAHYIFTFQDSTLECVVKEGKFWSPKIHVLFSEDEAKSIWSKLINDALI